MALCNFSVDFKGSAEELVAKAKQAIEDAGGTFKGDTSSGSFTAPTPFGKIEGTYTISGQTINIAITKKPLIASCSLIEKKLKEYLS
ncbi:MAG: hypothetical protein ABUK01_15390 [Leptospirales bacterium]